MLSAQVNLFQRKLHSLLLQGTEGLYSLSRQVFDAQLSHREFDPEKSKYPGFFAIVSGSEGPFLHPCHALCISCSTQMMWKEGLLKGWWWRKIILTHLFFTGNGFLHHAMAKWHLKWCFQIHTYWTATDVWLKDPITFYRPRASSKHMMTCTSQSTMAK